MSLRTPTKLGDQSCSGVDAVASYTYYQDDDGLFCKNLLLFKCIIIWLNLLF
ncbi:unnamed protein product [Gongylonema pulchrum]|uniref:Uncharacterized protein n=1 Tax=Gongylonema pulchrum TaxID=637853 RepID=A0A183ERG4_9BILA|nr:unnamed protein product [Gongylonema pulchrum]